MSKIPLLLLSLACTTLLAEQAPPLIGKWRGEAGSVDNRANYAIEFKQDKRGAIKAYMYQDNMGYFGIDVGEVKVAGDGRYTIPGADLKLTLAKSTLAVTGLLGTPSEAVDFFRSETLPTLSALPALPSGPGPLWQVRLGGAIYASAAIFDGTAYVGNVDGVFYAIKVADGTVTWAFSAGRPIYGEALATKDSVYFVCDNGDLYKLARGTGKELWRYDLGDARVARIPPSSRVFDYDRQSPRPLLIDGVLYVGAGDGGFHAVRADGGTRLWRTQSRGKIRTSAVARGPHVIFTTIDGADHGEVIALVRATGKRAWNYDAMAPVATVPSVAGNTIITGTRGTNTRLLGLDAGSGALLWSQYYWGSWVESEAVVADGNAYIGSGDLFTVSDFDPATGRNHWRTDVYGWVMARPLVTQDFVYAGVSSAHRNFNFAFRQLSSLTKLDRRNGKIIWRWPMPEWPGAFLNGFVAAPVAERNLVMIGGLNGTLYAFRTD